MDWLTILVTGALCIVCFLTGAKVGQAVSSGKDIDVPTINPMKAFREHQVKKEAEMEQNRIDIIMKNIESYDGTTRGQEDVPGR